VRVVVIGGGTAGWMTALMARKRLPKAHVTVVASSEVGILGAGEGTTPHFVGSFLEALDIDIPELIREVDATVKNGIRFVDWNGDGRSYMHPFHDHVAQNVDLRVLNPLAPAPPAALNLNVRLSEAGRTPFTPKRPFEIDPDASDPMERLIHHGVYALHFDARLLADYLRRVAADRGVVHVDGLVTSFRTQPAGLVDRVRLRDGPSLRADLVFDCTGFRRLVLQGLHQVPFLDLSGTLPVNRVIPFSLPLDGPPPPFTDALAMRAGWAFRIPTRRRYGCGYIFEERFCSEEQARAEILERFGVQADQPSLGFKAGMLERIWSGNCIAIGLSAGFLEPLEATSIWVSLLLLDELFRVYLPLGDERAQHEFNVFHRVLMERIVEFLYFHYLTQRTDTPFWSTFQERTAAPPRMADLLGQGQGLRPHFQEPWMMGGHPQPFESVSYWHVARGLGLIDWAAVQKYWDFHRLGEGYEERFRALQVKLEAFTSACMTHEAFLRWAGEQGD